MSRSSVDHVYVMLHSCFNHVETVFPAHLTRSISSHAQSMFKICWPFAQFEQLLKHFYYQVHIMLQSYLKLFTFHVSVRVCVSQNLYLHYLHEFPLFYPYANCIRIPSWVRRPFFNPREWSSILLTLVILLDSEGGLIKDLHVRLEVGCGIFKWFPKQA